MHRSRALVRVASRRPFLPLVVLPLCEGSSRPPRTIPYSAQASCFQGAERSGGRLTRCLVRRLLAASRAGGEAQGDADFCRQSHGTEFAAAFQRGCFFGATWMCPKPQCLHAKRSQGRGLPLKPIICPSLGDSVLGRGSTAVFAAAAFWACQDLRN